MQKQQNDIVFSQPTMEDWNDVFKMLTDKNY